MEVAEPLAELSWSRRKEDGVQSWPLQVCTLHLSKSHRVEDAAHQTGLLLQRGKTSLENSQ